MAVIGSRWIDGGRGLAVNLPGTLWVVCPVYFDVDSFLVLRKHIQEQLIHFDGAGGRSLRIVAIDDSGGQDTEMSALEALPDVTVLATPFNLGHQAALVYALRRFPSRCTPKTGW